MVKTRPCGGEARALLLKEVTRPDVLVVIPSFSCVRTLLGHVLLEPWMGGKCGSSRNAGAVGCALARSLKQASDSLSTPAHHGAVRKPVVGPATFFSAHAPTAAWPLACLVYKQEQNQSLMSLQGETTLSCLHQGSRTLVLISLLTLFTRVYSL